MTKKIEEYIKRTKRKQKRHRKKKKKKKSEINRIEEITRKKI